MLKGATVHISPFKDLTVGVLDALHQLRQQVFVVEQKCPYPDADGADSAATHVWITLPVAVLQALPPIKDAPLVLIDESTAMVGVARMFPPAYKHKGAVLGRIACHQAVRGSGMGKHLMSYLIEKVGEVWYPTTQGGSVLIYISAQVYLRRFYEGFGFVAQGESYLEDDIPHMDMILGTEKE
jgi:ElaA protein